MPPKASGEAAYRPASRAMSLLPVFVAGQLLQPLMEMIYLGLGEPVSLVFNLVRFNAGIAEQFFYIDITVFALNKLDIVVGDSAAV
jgi:hypothetical protein